jgi:small-conductance mechanosensitive channel
VVDETVSAQEFFDYLENHAVLGVKLSTFLSLFVIAVVAVVLERLFTRYLSRFARRARLAPHVTNGLVLTARLLILIGATVSAVRVGGLPTDWFVAFSAIGGAAVGFASTKTIGNFVAGLYLLAARPFRVGDLVRLGTVEGIVEEIAINYTKILTMGNNLVSVSNLQIMDRDITNYSYKSDEHDGLHCYTFEISFDHSVSSSRIAKILDEVFQKCCSNLPKRPRYVLLRSGGFERVYLIYLYVERPEDIFILRPQVAEQAFKLWDKERQKDKQ